MTQFDVDTINDTVVDHPFDVVVFDDPVTLMVVVVRVFMKVFGYSKTKAEHHMYEVHFNGKSVVWTGEQSMADRYCAQLQAHGLRATVVAGT